MLKNKSLLVSVLLLALVFVLTGCGTKKTADNEENNQAAVPQNLQTIKLGVVTALSGDAAAYGQEILWPRNTKSYRLLFVGNKSTRGSFG
ncbi:MAG: hypothetical protein NTV81_04635 [Candidatus Komeilibacteria bacterium]|nr:hypothetical protein [Candidatus Komeilibacteria bacterium]